MSDNDKLITLTHEQVCSLACRVAGATSIPFMRDHPTYVMPSEGVLTAVSEVLNEFGVDMARVHGYGQAVA